MRKGDKITCMKEKKLYVVMVGLPARGKSTIAGKLKENLTKDAIKTRIFNNGDLRRKQVRQDTFQPEFYDPRNKEGVALRETFALTNMRRAKDYLSNEGQVAILDATNVSRKRREKTADMLKDWPILFVECINDNDDILEASILTKIAHPEFRHLDKNSAIDVFKQRIKYYTTIYQSLMHETNRLKLDSLNNMIREEEIAEEIP